ncbi:MAG: Ig-like domain-containing protein [Candidatus Nanopelagicales bacterium]|nr:Ig-like domain-containing protein [Candidatus Nanopelagicales bacterium]
MDVRDKRNKTNLGGRRVRAIVGGAAALGIVLSACGPSLSLVTAPWGESQAVIRSALFGDRAATFDKPPRIRVDNGRIESVSVTGPNGRRVGGKLVGGGEIWELDTSDLEFGTKYKVTAKAVDLRGVESTANETFRTFEPEKVLTVTSDLSEDETYGVGMPITLTFDLPIKRKAEIEKRLRVETSGEPIEGAWSWDGDQSVTYRPRKYWSAKTDIKVAADLKGVNAGDDVYALENFRRSYSIGRRMILVQNSETHRLVVRRNGKVIRDIPSSTGKSGYATYSGIKVIMTKEPGPVVFDAATVGIQKGDPEYYRLLVYNVMRVTDSGEYIHSAPWSVGSQGYANVSHGCTNVSPENAAWLMDVVLIGDPVIFKNTGGSEVAPGNGITVWNESWDEWKAGSALQ